MQPDLGSNRGPSTYRVNALPTELSELPTHISPVPVHTQVTPATLLPPFLLRFDVEVLNLTLFRDVHAVQRAVTAPNWIWIWMLHTTEPFRMCVAPREGDC